MPTKFKVLERPQAVTPPPSEEGSGTIPAPGSAVRFRLDTESGFVWDDAAEEWLTSAETVFEAMEPFVTKTQSPAPDDVTAEALIQIASLASEWESSQLSTPTDHRRRWKKMGEIARDALKRRCVARRGVPQEVHEAIKMMLDHYGNDPRVVCVRKWQNIQVEPR